MRTKRDDGLHIVNLNRADKRIDLRRICQFMIHLLTICHNIILLNNQFILRLLLWFRCL